MSKKQVDLKKVLGLIYKYYEFLENFLPPYREGVHELPRYTLTQLVDKTGKDISYLSKLTDRLERAGLLEISEEPRDRGGRPYKVSQLSALGFRLLRAIEDSARPAEARPVEIDPWKIEECLSMMEDNTWSEEFRYRLANKLFELVSSDPVQALEKSGLLKRRFEEWVASPPRDEKVGERKRATISASWTRLLLNEDTRKWVLTRLYPNIPRLLDSDDPAIQMWALGRLSEVATNTEHKLKVAELLLERLLRHEVGSLERDKILREILVQLSVIVGTFTPEEKKGLVAKLRDIAKDESLIQQSQYILDYLVTSIFG